MGREVGYAKLSAAVDQALEMGCADVAAIRHLLQPEQLRHRVGEAIVRRRTGCRSRTACTLREKSWSYSH